MGYITRIRVEGLAGNTEPIEYDLDRHLNIFWGLNGCGKTSLLKILHSALSDNVSLLAKVPFTAATVEFYAERTKSVYRRSITKADLSRVNQMAESPLFYLEGEREFEFTFKSDKSVQWKTVRQPLGTGKKGDSRQRAPLPKGMKHGYLPISRVVDLPRDLRARGSGAPRSIDDDYLDVLFARQLRLRWQVYKSEALERIQSLQQKGIGEILNVLFGDAKPKQELSEGRLSTDKAYALASRFLKDQSIDVNFAKKSFESRYDSDPRIRQVIARIEEVEGEREMALRPQHELKAVIERLYGGSKTLELDGSDGIGVYLNGGDTKIPIEQLSSGERQLLRILLETMIAGTSTVIIDEPELSMHVDWQHELVASMRVVNPECQMILATHSPEVMALVPDENIFEL